MAITSALKILAVLMHATANFVLRRASRAKRSLGLLRYMLRGEATEMFLIVLLRTMSLVLMVDSKFRRNIENFEATYVFSDVKSHLYLVAIFKKNKLRVRRRPVLDPTFTIIFKDGKVLMKLLLSKSPNMLDLILKQEVEFKGSINYLGKFVYMALKLKQMAFAPGAKQVKARGKRGKTRGSVLSSEEKRGEARC